MRLQLQFARAEVYEAGARLPEDAEVLVAPPGLNAEQPLNLAPAREVFVGHEAFAREEVALRLKRDVACDVVAHAPAEAEFGGGEFFGRRQGGARRLHADDYARRRRRTVGDVEARELPADLPARLVALRARRARGGADETRCQQE